MELAKSADGIALDLRRGLKPRGYGRGDGDDRDDDGRGSARVPHRYRLQPAGTYTSHNSSAPDPVESQFPVPVE